jgi:hypothetical protein
MRNRKQKSEVLTIVQLLKMSKAERLRRGKSAGKRNPPAAKEPDPDAPHAILRKWRKAEKPIVIIE